jgi:hypothetical protein
MAVLFVMVYALTIVSARADDAADAKAIVARSIEAIGGKEKLEKFKAQTFKENGTYYGMGNGLPYTGVYAVQFPDQFKMEISGAFTMCIDGDKGWVQMAGDTRDMTAEELKNQQDQHYTGWVSTLTPLEDEKFTLATAGEVDVDGRPAAGVRVSSENHRDVTLYFDKETGRLVKMDTRAISPEMGNKEVNHEHIFSDFQEVEGVLVPMKSLILRDGAKFIEATVTELKPEGKLDDSVFARP